MTKHFLIWSIEHNAWWRPDECGYTKRNDQAGVYSQEDAERICAIHGRRRDMPGEAMVPVKEEGL